MLGAQTKRSEVHGLILIQSESILNVIPLALFMQTFVKAKKSVQNSIDKVVDKLVENL